MNERDASARKALEPSVADDVTVDEARIVSGSRTWQEQHARLMRAYDRATSAATVNLQAEDDYYSFFVRCFHLKDWLQNDPSVSAATKKAAEELINTNESLMLCADLANGIKHLRADRRPRVDPDSKVNAILASFPPGDSQNAPFQTGERILVFAAGSHQDARKLAYDCVALWKDFLEQQNMM